MAFDDKFKAGIAAICISVYKFEPTLSVEIFHEEDKKIYVGILPTYVVSSITQNRTRENITVENVYSCISDITYNYFKRDKEDERRL